MRRQCLPCGCQHITESTGREFVAQMCDSHNVEYKERHERARADLLRLRAEQTAANSKPDWDDL